MLKPGTLLGPYEILAQIGAGGMGEVYKGRDTRLDRLVAIKILPAHLADLPELRERFEREAHALANLKHANICVLYDIGSQELPAEDQSRERERPVISGSPEHFWPEEAQEAEVQVPRRFAPRDDSENSLGRRIKEAGHNTIHYLVMEYLEGETLSERLKKGPLPVEQVLQYATEIADALDRAHRDGFTHRDIKPGNIMLVPQSGAGPKTSSKVLDFGLAKLKQEVVKATLPASEMPTVPGGLTQHGTLLGTLQYMSPEQIEGKVDEVDGRTDVFAFGAVVYEMGTGKKAFPGETQASVIAKVLEVDPPPMSSLQPPGRMVPPALDRVVKRCLAKNREDRWQTMRDLCHELRWIAAGGSQAGMPAPLAARPKLRERLAWGMGAVMMLAVGLAIAYLLRGGEPESVRFSVPEPPGASFNAAGGPTAPYVSLSPDGRRLAFVASSEGRNRIWVRSLDSLEAQALPGTEGANSNPPFWSPDSRFLGFFAQGKLKKIEASGGPAQTLCDAPTAVSGTWNRDGTILFDSGVGRPQGGDLFRVSAAGGNPTPVTSRNESRKEVRPAWPHFLPDGRHFLYLAQTGERENSPIYVGALDSDETRVVLRAYSQVLYSPPGYLIYLRDNTLMAQPFDPDDLETTGDAFPIAEQVRYNGVNGSGAFSVSDTGVLAYRINDAGGERELKWFDRSGREQGRIGEPGPYVNPELSPDGKRLAVERNLTGTSATPGDIWVLDLTRGISSRFTSDPGNDVTPVWSPDGTQIAFASNRNGFEGLYQKNSHGLGNDALLLKIEQPFLRLNLADWSSDGRWIIYSIAGVGRKTWGLPLSGERKPSPILNTQFDERQAELSPDGRWIAYLSDESGQNEVYVQSFPEPQGKWQISTGGGVQPRWRPDGKELFYIDGDRKLMAVAVRAGSTFEAGTPVPLFETQTFRGFPGSAFVNQQYDITPDGQRFLMNVERETGTAAPITVVLNWTAGLRK